MKEIKLYKTPWKTIRLLVMSIALVCIGFWIASKNDFLSKSGILGIMTICFFSLGIIVALFHLFDKRPQIIINEMGIWDRTTNQDTIKWEQIKEAYTVRTFRQKFISLVVDDNYKFKTKQYKWASKLNEVVEAQKLNLSLGQIKIDELKFIEFINKMSHSEKDGRSTIIQNYFG